jgi:hypothetical protein
MNLNPITPSLVAIFVLAAVILVLSILSRMMYPRRSAAGATLLAAAITGLVAEIGWLIYTW